MGFHRRTTPTYFGGLPAGYDYLNNPVANGDPGAAAPADGKKATGPNQGTYFVAFGEDATASNTNRGLNAVAENTDLLDDLVRTSQVVMRVQTGLTVGAVSSLVVTGDVYVGSPSDSPATANDAATRSRLIKIVDSNDNELEVGGVRVVATLIHNGASVNQVGVPASGFYTNPTLTISPAIPAATSYRIYYLARRSFNDIVKLKPGEFFFEQIRTAHRVDAQLRAKLRELQGSTKDWDDGWTSTIDDIARRGLDGMYRNCQDQPVEAPNDFEFFAPIARSVDSAGSGGWIFRDGPAFTIYGAGNDMYVDPIQALMRLEADDDGVGRGTTGLVTVGNRMGLASVVGEGGFFPSLATMMSTIARRQLGTAHATDPRTRIVTGSVVTLVTVNADPETGESYIELPVGQYFWETTLNRSAINIGYDMIELQLDFSGNIVYRTYVMVKAGSSSAPTNNRRMRLRCLDGTIPDFAGLDEAFFRRWHSVVFAVGDGLGPRHMSQHLYPTDESVKLNGPFFQVPTEVNGTGGLALPVPSFSAREQGSADAALGWGGLGVGLGSGTPPTGYAQKGYLTGDGGIIGDGKATMGGGFLATTAGVQTKLGHYPYLPTTTTVTSATTTLACAYDTQRYFIFDANTTPTLGQNVTVTFTGSPALSTGMQMTIIFVQPSSGASGGAMDITSWPASALFETESDKHPAVGYDKITIWRGEYILSNWRFTKHVY